MLSNDYDPNPNATRNTTNSHPPSAPYPYSTHPDHRSVPSRSSSSWSTALHHMAERRSSVGVGIGRHGFGLRWASWMVERRREWQWDYVEASQQKSSAPSAALAYARLVRGIHAWDKGGSTLGWVRLEGVGGDDGDGAGDGTWYWQGEKKWMLSCRGGGEEMIEYEAVPCPSPSRSHPHHSQHDHQRHPPRLSTANPGPIPP